MKKPFVLLKGPRDYFVLGLSICLCVFALYLFFKPQKTVAVFSQTEQGLPKSFYGLLERSV